LELEYLEALGGQSIDDVIDSGSGSVAVELELETQHQGKVISIHREDVFLEIGGRQQGMAQLKNFPKPPEIGAVIEVVISRFNAADGVYEVILPGAAVDVGDWSEVAEGMVVEARVTGHNKGGLECEVNQLRGFIPASQVSLYRVEDLSKCEGEIFKCVITEANPEKRNLVLSHRAIMERERAEAKEKLMASLKVGQIHEGTVRSLQNFGAFVDLGGIDGLVHISQLSWDRIKHPSEVLEIEQKIRVKIEKIDPQSGKIGLAFRDLSESPWASADADYPVSSQVKGRVTRLMDFGAFVRLGPGVEGLIHISELAHRRVMRVSDVLGEDQEVEVQVLSVDTEAQRISLSLKALEARPSTAKDRAGNQPDDEPDTPRPPPKKRKTPLRGGIGGPSSGEQFGLRW
jgi:ribosomal protein S1